MDFKNTTQRYVRAEGVEVYPAGEELVAIHLANDEIHRLNLTARQVLEACDGRAAGEITAHVREAYPQESAERIERDVEALLQLLMDKGVIKAQGAGEAGAHRGSD